MDKTKMYCFTEILFKLVVFHFSFLFMLPQSSLILAENEVDVPFIAEQSTIIYIIYSLCFDLVMRIYTNHHPLHKETSLLRSESRAIPQM